MNLEKAVEFCRIIEEELSMLCLNAHVALTGGCLYKKGERKDCDIIIYPHADLHFDPDVIMKSLIKSGKVYPKRDYGRVYKVQWQYNDVDILFPGRKGKYPEEIVDQLVDLDDEVSF